MKRVAALYVQTNGSYYGLDDVDPWDETRDARKYDGPEPVVAHPPCARWSALAKFVEHQHGYKVGDDGGCFERALSDVRKWGGVLEHPAWSWAFAKFGLGVPLAGSWQRLLCGGWITSVCQSAYGHRAKKTTWLYAFGVVPPSLDWREVPGSAVVSSCTRMPDGSFYRGDKPRLGPKEASKTPIAFRDLLLDIARGARK